MSESIQGVAVIRASGNSCIISITKEIRYLGLDVGDAVKFTLEPGNKMKHGEKAELYGME